MKHRMNNDHTPRGGGLRWLLALAVASGSALLAQDDNETDGDIFELSPFSVEADDQRGYQATTTLAGTRLRSNLRDIGSSITVLTEEFLEDVGGTDAVSVLTYATNMEVAGPRGNFQGAPPSEAFRNTDETARMFSPSTSTRVRGLVEADNTRSYFRSFAGWDSYNVDRIDLLRGPNSILFGLGSPGGVVNASVVTASVASNHGEVGLVIDEHGTTRATADLNRVLLEDQLAIRVALLNDRQDFQQEGAYDNEERVFLTTKYRPAFLNSDSTTFELVLDYENGNGNSNRPRTAPPIDHVTPWFEPQTIQQIQLPEGTNYNGYANGVIPAMQIFADKASKTWLDGVSRNTTDGTINWFSAFGARLELDENYNGGWRVGRVFSHGALLPDGTTYTGNPNRARNLFGAAFLHQVVADTARGANELGHPFSNAFEPVALTDPSVFDFYNKLIDGPNKREWADFDQFRAVLSNTFMNQKFGYELSFFSEEVERGQTTFLSDSNRIFIDMFTEDIEGNPNPHFGKAYIQENTWQGNRTRDSEIDAFRASAYFDHDFRDAGSDGWLSRVLGRHVFNAALSEDKTLTDSRRFSRHVYSDELLNEMGWGPKRRFNNNTMVSMRTYISDDLSGRSTAAGANIDALDRFIIPEGGAISLRYFDRTWNAPDTVDPAAPWVNPLGQTWEEASNPANYVGWTTADFEIVDALSGSQADKDLATRVAVLQENTVESQILSWQGFLFNESLVGTFGWRKDQSDSIRMDAPERAEDNGDDVRPEVYNLGNGERFELETISRNYSVVAHLHKMLGNDRLPLNISLSYNSGENFNPTAGRLDMAGLPIEAPQGETEEIGVVFYTKDNRYMFKVAEFETKVRNASSAAIPANFRFNQFLALNGAAWKVEEGVLRDEYEAAVEKPDWSIDDQENIHLPAWREFEAAFAERFPSFIDSWLEDGTWNPSIEETTFRINGTTTEDNVSEGYEFEFVANPTDQLRLAFNASKTKALRDNVPGETTAAVYEFVQDAMFDGTEPTLAGQLRSGFDSDETIADFWLRENWANFSVVQQLNGQLAPELVEWRFNGLANYSFREGKLKGVGIGGAYRYESGSSVGFPRFFDEFGFVKADIDNPIERDATDRVDLWLSYQRPLMNEKINWKVQLNLFNIFGDNELIPTKANPDGTFAQFRIQEGTSWRLANTFEF